MMILQKHNLVALGLIMMTGTLSITARELTPAQALNRALSTIESSTIENAPRRAAFAKDIRPSYTSSVEINGKSSTAYYIFNAPDNKGFVIAGADDSFRPLIAYSENGNINMTDLPENTVWWLSEYDRQIEWFLSHPTETAIPSKTPEGKKVPTPKLYTTDRNKELPAIPYMVQSLWNQGAPYNERCPKVNGERSVTGCVATAMAQVVNYHKFANGKGIVNYRTRSNGVRVEFYFSNWTPDWDNMLDTYVDNNWTNEEAAAVASLMRACGSAVFMDYTPNSSGAFSADIAPGLIEYMGYDEQTSYFERGSLIGDWENLCYDAISQGFPLLYSGAGTAGGHCFVCDGYAGEGLFHINWGWGGLGPDGMYALSALDPGALGTGGGAGGFNYGQSVCIPVPEGKTYIKPDVETAIIYMENMTGRSKGQSLKIKGDVHTSLTSGAQFYYGYILTDSEGYPLESELIFACDLPNSNYYYPSEEIEINLTPDYMSELPDGTYYLYPAYMMRNEVAPWRMHVNGTRQCFELQIASGSIKKSTLTSPPDSFDLSLESINPDILDVDSNSLLTVSVKNKGNASFKYDSLYLAYRDRSVPESWFDSDEDEENKETEEPGDEGEEEVDPVAYQILASDVSILGGETATLAVAPDYSLLEAGKEYDVYIGYISDFSDIFFIVAPHSRILTVKDSSDIKIVNVDEMPLRVKTKSGRVTIYNVPAGEEVEVYNGLGVLMDKGISSGNPMTLNGAEGICILRANGKSMKLIL